MSTQRNLDAELVAVQADIEEAKKERKTAKENLEKAIQEGKPADVRADLKALLESATTELTRLGQEKSDLMKVATTDAQPQGILN
jgi:seryl-tRNA synthetase